MKTTVLPVFFLLFVITEGRDNTISSANVQIYSKLPGHNRMGNTLICHVKDFYPPDITIHLLKNGVELKEAQQTDLAFEDQWHFHLTKYMAFTPQEGDTYSCRVTHMGEAKVYTWDPDE